MPRSKAAPKKRRCYLYTRVSSQSQVDGYSLDAQRDRLLKAAEYEGMTVAAEFSDEGKSGKNTTGRPEFTEMMNRIQHGNPDKIDYVLVFKLSRFGRNTADVMNSLQLMVDNGVNLLAVEDKIDSSGPAGKLMIAVLAAVAEIERENIRTQVKAGMLQKAREGGWNGGQAPLGYRIVKDADGKNGHLAIDEEEAKLIRLIFDKYAHTGMGYAGVAKWLNRNGYRRTARQNAKHATFTEDFVKSVLDNPVYTGKIVHGRFQPEKLPGKRNEYRVVEQDEYPQFDGMHEAIVSDELWEEVRAKRKATSGKPQQHYGPKNVYMLSGLVKCPGCGTPMLGTFSRNRRKDGSFAPTVLYYACKHGKHATGNPCTYNRGVRAEVLDAQVLQVVQRAVGSMYVQKGLITSLCSPEDLGELEAKLDGLRAARGQEERKKSRLLGKIARLDADDDQYDRTYDDLQSILIQHNQAIAELDGQIEAVSVQLDTARNGASSFLDVLRMFHRSMESIESWTPEQKREFMHNFLEYVEIYPKAQDGGRLVKRIRFKIPVSVDGGLTYGRDVDLDDDGDGDTPPDGNPPDGGGQLPPIGPCEDGDFPIGDVLPSDGVDLQAADALPDRDTPPSDGVDLQTAEAVPNQGTGFPETESLLVRVRLHRGSL